MPKGIYQHKPNQGFQKGNKFGKRFEKGIIIPFEWRMKISKANKGKKQSFEQIRNRFEKRKGYKHSEETKRKIGMANENSFKLSGSSHPNWKGGEGNRSYGIGWTKTLKQIIQRKDNYRCQLCGVPQEECIKTLVIHHIDYNKKNHNHNNLVTLCRICHNKTNFNRQYWLNHFNKKMEEKYGKIYA